MIKFCRNCVMPNSRPRVIFNEQGICNACTNADNKKEIDWEIRKKEFLILRDNLKNISKNNNNIYDCIVPWSGGKDSTSIALKLKFEFDLNPLLVTFSPLIPNEVGEHNRQILLDKGFDNIFLKPNQKVSKELAKRFFFERGNPKVAWDAGVNSGPVNIAVKFKIPAVFYAEHGESEYGGNILSEESIKYRNLEEVIEHQIGDYPENWVSKFIKKNDLAMYIYPKEEELSDINLKAYYFSYFFKWSMYENFNYVKDKIPHFKTNPSGRTSGTFTDFDSLDDKIDPLYYYMQFIKFGFGRSTRDSSRLIQNNQMTRDKAIEHVKQYDAEFPSEHFNEVLDFLNLNNTEFEEIVNKHRNNEIWQSNINNKWELKYKI